MTMSAKPSMVSPSPWTTRDAAARRPQLDLVRPVGLDDVRHDHQQREGVGGLRGEQRLRGLAQAGLVGEQERAVAGRRRRDDLGLVVHQLQARRAGATARGSGSGMQVASPRGVLEGAEAAGSSSSQPPAGWSSGARRHGREVGGQERVGQLARR